MIKKPTNFEKSEKILNFFKSYILPLIVFVIGLAVAWATLNGSVVTNAQAIEQLQVKCDKNEDIINIVLQRLSSIDTKLEYIIKEIDKN